MKPQLLDGGQRAPCSFCGNPTQFTSKSYAKPMCSIDCENYFTDETLACIQEGIDANGTTEEAAKAVSD